MYNSKLNDKNEACGSWFTCGEGDVGIYQQGGATVIGWNKGYNDKVEFSDIAFISSSKEGLRLQFADGNGNMKNVKVSEATVSAAILEMLKGLKAKADSLLTEPCI